MTPLPRAAAALLLASTASSAPAQETELGPSGERVLTLAGEPRDLALRVERDGDLFLTAESDALDPALSVADDGGSPLAADDDGGGDGRTAFLRLPAVAGELYRVRVAAAGDGSGEVLLRWAASVESEATRAAAAAAGLDLDEIGALTHGGDTEAARIALVRAVRALIATEGAEESAEIYDRLLRLAGPALEIGSTEALALAVEHALLFQDGRLPSAHFEHLSTLNRAAILSAETNDYGAGRDVLERVLAALEDSAAPDGRNLQVVRTNLAVMRFFLGDIAGSRELSERVVGALEDGGDPRQLAIARGVLIGALWRDGELDRALELGEAMLEACERLALPEHLQQSTHQVYALVLQEAGENVRAEEILFRLLEQYERTPPRSRSFVLEVQERLSALEWQRGDHAAALARLDAVLLEVKAEFGPGDPWRTHLLATRARRLSELGRGEALAVTLGEIADGLLARAHDLAGFQSPRELEEAFGAPVLASALDTLIDLDPSASRVFHVVESLRGLGLQSALRLRAARAHPDVAAGIEELREAHASVRLAHDTGASVEEAVRARDATARDLLAAAREAIGAARWDLEIDADELALAPGRAALSYRRYGTPDGPRYVAFVLAHEGAPQRIDLGDADALDGRIDDWRSAVRAGEDPDRIRAAGAALATAVLGPLELDLDAVERLITVPDDALHLVPFDALPTAGGVLGDQVVVERRASLHEVGAPAETTAGRARLVAFGGVDYGAPLEAETTPSLRGAASFPPLPGTADEVEIVAALFRARGGDDAAVELRLGGRATREALLDGAGAASALHLSTHGFFETGAGEADVAFVRATGLGAARLSPLSSTGLALAGANLGRDALGRTRGRVTAEELAGLDLSGCGLVVLSACDTGLGRVRAGQGVASLQRAFRMAGARTVVSSLWRVSDAATLELMRAFYEALWVDGRPPAEALWKAKRALRAERRPLRDWAGWVLTGEPD